MTAPTQAAPRMFPLIDPTLTHQIVLLHEGVSCNCRASGRPQARKHVVFAPLGTADQALAAYGDPANHRGAFP